MALVKVYNKGTRPIVWARTRQGSAVIHPKKFDLLGEEKAKEIISQFPDACTEEEYNKKSEVKKADK